MLTRPLVRTRRLLWAVAGLLALARPAIGQRTGPAVQLVEAPPEILAAIDPERLAARLGFLADDLLEGRGTGQRGGDLAARYVATELSALGMQSAGSQGFMLPVALVGARSDATLVIGAGRRTIVLEDGSDFVAWPERPEGISSIDGELVFAGFGVEAPELEWSANGSTSVRGKIVMVRPGEPAQDGTPDGQGSQSRYGSWAYKVAQADRVGALGLLLIHAPDLGVGPWGAVTGAWGGEVVLPEGPGAASLRFAAWVTPEAARRIVEVTGKDYDLLLRRAEATGFQPIDLGAHAALDGRSQMRSFRSPNVVARVDGSDSSLARETVLVVAHYDHLGIGPAQSADSIYDGFVDNASGVGSLLELAASLASAPRRPRRSVVFAATTAGEHRGAGAALLTRSLSANRRVVAVLNLDQMNVWGPSTGVAIHGSQASSLGRMARAAAEREGMTFSEAASTTEDLYGNDQLPFVQAEIPTLRLGQSRGSLPEQRQDQITRYRATQWHQPGDEAPANVDVGGLVQQTRMLARLVWHLAETETMPTWQPYGANGRP